jgi:hypothetical protein
MPDKDLLVSRIFLRAALPLTKVLAEERPLYKKAFPKSGVVQFAVKNNDAGAHMIFTDGELDVVQGLHAKPDLTVEFKSLSDLNKFFGGKVALPKIKGLFKLHLLLRVLPLLLALKLLMPDALPADPDKKALKVKLVLYMITNALSQLNKAGDEGLTKLTKNSPDRIFQWTVEGGGPAAYLRIKNGKSKAGRGTYTRRRPFVHMIFPNIEGAFLVLTSQVPLVEAVSKGHVRTEGAMEYSKEIGYHMQRVEEMTSTL